LTLDRERASRVNEIWMMEQKAFAQFFFVCAICSPRIQGYCKRKNILEINRNILSKNVLIKKKLFPHVFIKFNAINRWTGERKETVGEVCEKLGFDV
jgi:hypothetical protein